MVDALTLDDAGEVWAGTADGQLLRLHQDLVVNETPRTLAVPRAIHCLCVTANGNLWIGYAGGGLGWLTASRFFQFQTGHGLHDDNLAHIVPDGRGRLWFAGNRGVFQVQQAEFEALAAGRTARLRSVVFGREQGLPGLRPSRDYSPGALRSRDGRLWLPMLTGVAVVNPADLKENLAPPPVVIEQVVVDGRTVAAYETGEFAAASQAPGPIPSREAAPRLHLSPGHQQVQFEFTALSFAAPENVEFKIRLRGFDKNWLEVGGRRAAYYPHLPPGDYTFDVTACNSDGIWSEAGASLALTATPRLWETLWFRLTAPAVAFSLLGGGALLALRRRQRQQVERLELERGMERERSRIAQDLHDDLGAGLTQISLNPALAQNPAVTPDLASGLLQEIDQRAPELVTALDEIVWAVNPKNDTVPALARYLCQFAQTCAHPAGMACRLEVAPSLPEVPVGAEQRHHLFLAFKEALHNALQHSGASELKLAITVNAQTLAVTLADNGRGFAPAPGREGADGLDNMQTRLERLGGRCAVTSAPGQGTTVTLLLPLAGQQPSDGSEKSGPRGPQLTRPRLVPACHCGHRRATAIVTVVNAAPLR